MFARTAVVQKNETVARDCFSLCLQEEKIAGVCSPGQFVHIRLSPGLDPFLRRPFSIAEARPERGEFRLLIHAVGEGTRYLQKLREGQTLDCLGPLGTGFVPRRAPFALVAGGIGAAPLLFLAQELARSNHDVSFYYGTAALADRVSIQSYLPGPVEIVHATEDGSVGFHGRVTEALNHAIQQGKLPGQVMACGPAPMFRELVRLNTSWRIPMLFSLEERMACGTGACQGCVVEVEEQGERLFQRVCREGPVFDALKVVEFREDTPR